MTYPQILLREKRREKGIVNHQLLWLQLMISGLDSSQDVLVYGRVPTAFEKLAKNKWNS